MATKTRKHRESFGTLRKLPSGRYQASYVGADGNRYYAPQTFGAIIDARGWLSTQQAELHKGEWSPSGATAAAASKRHRADTVSAYAAEWLTTRVNRHGDALRPRTRSEYERLLEGPLAELAESRLVALTPAKVRTWYTEQLATGRRTQSARAYSLLKSILATAVVDGRIPTNPCVERGAASASSERIVEPPTAAELERIVTAIHPRYRAMVLIAAWGGLRYGELTELRRKDLQPVPGDDGTPPGLIVQVARAVAHVTGQGFIVGKTKSAAGVRSVALPPHVIPAIEEHLKTYTADFPDSLLWPAADGRSHLAESSFVKHWYPARDAAKRPDLNFHALRHFAGTMYARTGATLKEIQARLGHSTVAAAMRYQHAAGRDTELAGRMSEAWALAAGDAAKLNRKESARA